MTKNPDVRVAKSIVDYVFRWLATKFLSSEAQFHAGVNVRPPAETNGHDDGEQLKLGDAEAADKSDEPAGTASFAIQNDQDAPPCATCGAIMIRSGACYKCINCGATSGCA